MVLLKHSAWSFVCGRYAVVVRCCTSSSAHTVAKSLFTNWTSLLVGRYAGVSYGMSK